MDVIYRDLGVVPYGDAHHRMQTFTQQRQADTLDEIWFLQHPAIYTQGYAGKAEHILNPGNIPIYQSDRGGQVTYHGPGQLIAYTLIDLPRMGLKIRTLVRALEQSVMALLNDFGIAATTRCDAPGVYVDQAKICSLGLRVKRHCSFHGLAFNVSMDLEPFNRINPCGLTNVSMTQLQAFVPNIRLETVKPHLRKTLIQHLGYTHVQQPLDKENHG